MPKAIRESEKGFKIGNANPFNSEDLSKTVLDGDTVKTFLDGYVNARFLGVDTPEKGFDLPYLKSILDLAQVTSEEERKKRVYRDTNHPAWVKYLEDPFNDNYEDSHKFKDALGAELITYLKHKIGPSTALNHHSNSLKSAQILLDIIKKDNQETVQAGKKYKFFFRFSHEVLDVYGRLLAYVHQDKEAEERGPNISYNELMLKAGYAIPYYIFPNIDPFIKYNSILDAIPDVHGDRFAFFRLIQKSSKLRKAREAITEIRNRTEPSLFTGEDSLKLLPFELRFLQRRQRLNKYVMDLSNPEPIIYPPQDYYFITKEEDRFFIPEEYIPIFEKRGYKVIEG
ncbi:MAG TPA: hypothetical protein VLE21_03850 [Candidatus Nitrosocosmicus sp.]|nr:hypothetical protein [Candidatus Nitrosocosmicus sp.]